MDLTISVQKAIDESIYIFQDLLKKYKLGQGNFERVTQNETRDTYCFKITLKIANKTLVFPLAINTFGQKFMVSKIGGLHKVPYTFENLEIGFIYELQLLGLISKSK